MTPDIAESGNERRAFDPTFRDETRRQRHERKRDTKIRHEFLCLDCRYDTACDEYYVLHDSIWLTVNPKRHGMLCIGCVEERLGRHLGPEDFTDSPLNTPDDPNWLMSSRLRSRITGRENVS